jgi:hypothetical protein
VYDFLCKNGHRDEYFVSADTTKRICDRCGAVGERVVSAPRAALDPISGDFPGATMAWERKREEKMAQERKNKANHGTYGDGRWEKAHGVS